MKSLRNILSLLIMVILAGTFQACEKLFPENNGKGTLEISINTLVQDSIHKSATEDSVNNNVSEPSVGSSHQIMITVVDENGTAILDDELIPVYNFGGSFVSQRIELNSGKYRLTKFMVISPEGKVVFAAPLEGSPKSYLVNRCLPIGFIISPEQVTRVIPEVLAIVNESPEEFGYAAFGFQVVRPLPFYVMAVIDPDDSRIMAPTSATEAMLTVQSPGGWQHSFKLRAVVNLIEIRAGSDYYFLIGEKEGFPPQKLRFTTRELLASSIENPIIIPFSNTQVNVLTIKPGPREGKDAMISNLDPDKNFGDHHFFETTFLSEPVLTVMRSNRSLIWFNLNELPKSALIKRVVLTLFYDIPIPWDYQGGDSPVSSIAPWYGAVLQQIVEPWEEYKVTWNNQPKTTEINQVYLTPFVRNVNFIEIDVSRLYISDSTVAIPNHGMLFKLYPTEQFPGFRFASSDFPEPRMHPELKVFYTLP